VRDLGSRVVLVLGTQCGVLGRLGHPTDLDLALARQWPAGEPDLGTPTSSRPPNKLRRRKREI